MQDLKCIRASQIFRTSDTQANIPLSPIGLAYRIGLARHLCVDLLEISFIHAAH